MAEYDVTVSLNGGKGGETYKVTIDFPGCETKDVVLSDGGTGETYFRVPEGNWYAKAHSADWAAHTAQVYAPPGGTVWIKVD